MEENGSLGGIYFWAGIRLSMDCPFSSLFSMSTSSLTPSTTICTSSTSEKPSLSALEMSKTPPTAAVSTPPDGKAKGFLNATQTHLTETDIWSISKQGFVMYCSGKCNLVVKYENVLNVVLNLKNMQTSSSSRN